MSPCANVWIRAQHYHLSRPAVHQQQGPDSPRLRCRDDRKGEAKPYGSEVAGMEGLQSKWCPAGRGGKVTHTLRILAFHANRAGREKRGSRAENAADTNAPESMLLAVDLLLHTSISILPAVRSSWHMSRTRIQKKHPSKHMLACMHACPPMRSHTFVDNALWERRAAVFVSERLTEAESVPTELENPS